TRSWQARRCGRKGQKARHTDPAGLLPGLRNDGSNPGRICPGTGTRSPSGNAKKEGREVGKHRTVKGSPPDPRVGIDEKIAGLLRQCWRLGLGTRFCCQGDNPPEEWGESRAYITFQDWRQALLFAAAAGPMAWSERAHGQRDRESRSCPEPWRWAWWHWR